MNALTVKELSKTFKGGIFERPKQALKNVSFSVKSERVTGFVGVNGSGKTTSLKCIFNFIKPDSGEVLFFDHHPISSEIKSRIGFFPERPYLYEFLTAHEFLKFHWDLGGGGPGFLEARDRVLSEVNLKGVESRRLKGFSKGMLQRIGIAQAILKKPDFLILDEPMSGLDPDGRILIKQIIRNLAQQKTTIFFSSHLLHDLDELCQDLVVIDGGEVLFQGALNDFKKTMGEVDDLSLEEAFRKLKQKVKEEKGREQK
jgi:ABC-2 type transport system ATP-binding protein